MHEAQTTNYNCCDYTTGDTNYKLDCYSLKTGRHNFIVLPLVI